MKFYFLLNNKSLSNTARLNLSLNLKDLRHHNKISDTELKSFMKDIEIIKKSLRHNLIAFQDDKNPNIFYLITKTTEFKGLEGPRNAFESSEKGRLVDINQTDSRQGFAKCLFMFELQDTSLIDDYLKPLDDAAILESFGSLENAKNLYDTAQEFYNINKTFNANWIDVTRYFEQCDEVYKQYSYLDFVEDPYYPLKKGSSDKLFEIDSNKELDIKNLKIIKPLNIKKKPEEEL